MNLFFLKSFGQDNLLAYWPNILYINNYVPAPMGWTWSLAIEEQFYIIVPFLLVFIFPKFRNKTSFFVILSAISITLGWYYVYVLKQYTLPFNLTFSSNEWKAWFNGYYVVTHLRYIGLLSGVAIAYLTVYKSDETKDFFEKRSGAIFVISILAVFLVIIISFIPLGEWMPMKSSIFSNLNVHVGKWYEILVRPVFSICVAFIITACVYGNNVIINGVKTFLSSKFFYPIAQVSYSAYLFHEMFIVWAAPKLYAYLTPNYSHYQIFLITVFVSLVAILFASVIMYYLIEQPFQKIRDKIKFN
jgi:peptidoglycan/LPS O-acetylase OafA/YrhL